MTKKKPSSVAAAISEIADDMRSAGITTEVDGFEGHKRRSLDRAKRHGEVFASLHEAYAVMLEELDEVWDITRMKRSQRTEPELRKELIQIAAMAVKALQSMSNFTGGSV